MRSPNSTVIIEARRHHSAGDGRPAAGGFTLIELISVIIILGVLAAIALPRYIAMGRDARVAVVNTLASTLRSQAETLHAMCKLDSICDYASPGGQFVTLAGRVTQVNYGWVAAGTNIGGDEIDIWVNYNGFSISIGNPVTYFTLDGSPDPANCAVSYTNAYYRGPALGILITATTSGC